MFKKADKNSNGIIEFHEIEDLLTGYFELKGFTPPREFFDYLINHYKKKHPKGMDMRHFEHFIDHINVSFILPSYTKELANRKIAPGDDPNAPQVPNGMEEFFKTLSNDLLMKKYHHL